MTIARLSKQMRPIEVAYWLAENPTDVLAGVAHRILMQKFFSPVKLPVDRNTLQAARAHTIYMKATRHCRAE